MYLNCERMVQKMAAFKTIFYEKTILLIASIILSITIACNNENNEPAPVPKYDQCNDLLAIYCDGEGVGEYCTFGYKWGSDNPFVGGLEEPGPGTSGGVITFKFEKGGLNFDTHAEVNRTSVSVNTLNVCYRDTIVAALRRWEEVCDIELVEVGENESSDIRIIFGNIRQSGLGFPAFNESPCSEISGMLVFRNDNFDCNIMYRMALHEIGHALGLGHIVSPNIMNAADFGSFDDLQAGDIEGIQSVYGVK